MDCLSVSVCNAANTYVKQIDSTTNNDYNGMNLQPVIPVSVWP